LTQVSSFVTRFQQKKNRLENEPIRHDCYCLT